jgi:carbonic anhydrase
VTGATVPDEGLAILRRLAAGNRRFVAGRLEHPRQDPVRRKELAGGQDPDVILVTCSDSRVDPDALFDAGLGDIFAIENAGGLVFALEQEASLDMASIEYMARHYGEAGRCGVLLVLAHTHCGAVAASLAAADGGGAGSPHLDLLVSTIAANVPGPVRAEPGPGNRRAAEANADAVLRSVCEGSAIVRQAVVDGHLVCLTATYDLETGHVHFPAWAGGS